MLFPRSAQLIACFVTLSFVIGISPAGLQSARAQTAQNKAEAPAQSPAAANQKPDYSHEAVVIEQLNTAYRFERDGTGQRDLHMRVKVQSDAGVERFGQLVFPYSSANEKLDMDFVRVRKADGTVVNAAATDVQDLSAPVAREAPIYTDLRHKHITVPGLRPGDVLEYHLVWTVHTALAPNHFWVEHDFVKDGVIVLNDELVVNIPAGGKVKLKTEAGFEPAIKEQDGRRIYSWKHANLKPDSDKEEEEKEKDKDGSDVYLRDIWPAQEEIQATIAQAVQPEMFKGKYADVFSGNPTWNSIEAKESELYPWDPASTYITPSTTMGVASNLSAAPSERTWKTHSRFRFRTFAGVI